MTRTMGGSAGGGDEEVQEDNAFAASATLSVSDNLYVGMFKRMTFCKEAALELVQTEQINSRNKLERSTDVRVSKICKAIRSPGGGGNGAHVTEGAEHNLVIVAAVYNNASRVNRAIGPMDIKLSPNDMFHLHENQMAMENEWENKTMAEIFKPVTEKDTKKGWKSVYDDFEQRVKSVRRKVSKALIAYLTRPNLFPEPAALDPADDYANFDHKLIGRHPIILPKHNNAIVSTLEAGGPKMKLAHVNQDNTQLYVLAKTTFEGTAWWIHARKAQQAKDGRQALPLMEASLMSSNAMDEANTKNRRDMLALEYNGESKGWTLLKYVAVHKKCYTDQSNLCLVCVFVCLCMCVCLVSP